MRPEYQQVLDHIKLKTVLTGYDYQVIGTPPLMIDMADSDIDIACYSQNPSELAQHLAEMYGDINNYREQNLETPPYKTMLVAFEVLGWEVEFFICNQQLDQQYGVRHFELEKRLLAVLGAPFKQAVISLKNQGIKTEPAFANLLRIKGDPYINLLKLEIISDKEVSTLYSQYLN